MPTYGSNDGYGRQKLGDRPSTRLTEIGRQQHCSSAMASLLAEEDLQPYRESSRPASRVASRPTTPPRPAAASREHTPPLAGAGGTMRPSRVLPAEPPRVPLPERPPPERPYSNAVCAACQAMLGFADSVEALGSVWHASCFATRPTGQRPPSARSRPAATSGSCAGCGGRLGAEYCTALGNRWHESCFVCAGCRRGLGAAKFVEGGGQPYHKACYLQAHGERCRGCGEFIDGGTSVQHENGDRYHERCFKCVACGASLRDGYVAVGGQPYCAAHANGHPAARPADRLVDRPNSRQASRVAGVMGGAPSAAPPQEASTDARNSPASAARLLPSHSPQEASTDARNSPASAARLLPSHSPPPPPSTLPSDSRPRSILRAAREADAAAASASDAVGHTKGAREAIRDADAQTQPAGPGVFTSSKVADARRAASSAREVATARRAAAIRAAKADAAAKAEAARAKEAALKAAEAAEQAAAAADTAAQTLRAALAASESSEVDADAAAAFLAAIIQAEQAAAADATTAPPTAPFAWQCAFCGAAHEREQDYCDQCAKIRHRGPAERAPPTQPPTAAAMAPAAAPAAQAPLPVKTTVEKVQTLSELLAAGLISMSEFEARRAAILDAL